VPLIHRVRIKVEDHTGDILDKISALNAAMFQVLMGQKLIEIEEVNYRRGDMTLLLEINPKKFCLPQAATIKVKVERVDPADCPAR
jgi:hypothetical protein